MQCLISVNLRSLCKQLSENDFLVGTRKRGVARKACCEFLSSKISRNLIVIYKKQTPTKPDGLCRGRNSLHINVYVAIVFLIQ